MALLAAVSITPTTIFFVPFEGLDEPVWEFAFFQTLPEIAYLCVSVLFALFITSAYANSRTMLARIAPQQEMTKFFGLYALSGQATAFVAPLMVAFATGLFDSQRVGFASVLILLGIGVVMMLFVKEERAVSISEAGAESGVANAAARG